MQSVTGLYAGLLGLIYLALCWGVVRLRQKHKVGLGDGGHRDLAQAIRVHGNFAEYVPLALILLYFVEIQHSATWPIIFLGALLTMGRVLHAIGLGRTAYTSPGRFWGTVLTWTALLLSSLLAMAPWVGLRF